MLGTVHALVCFLGFDLSNWLSFAVLLIRYAIPCHRCILYSVYSLYVCRQTIRGFKI